MNAKQLLEYLKEIDEDLKSLPLENFDIMLDVNGAKDFKLLRVINKVDSKLIMYLVSE